ncbi:NAD/NADP-dependent indole-3-acetaldehyde reductase [Psilocybe cubensis]|uniref:NAD/NADP-dependent indole-3-acetaldehyde reductase n=2 Tax=Psilocybe cubensis TaxID=181762 RepID=A0ACB8GQC8_PSICU|nr:NAD/NADP-dependent indole-3-acetaldehyde reductase [Psilocybe cubensis]KAH9477675.1 NAD/NADP-dependent indole-3-acetaldehyde reductase [Psilocybe cubensis]
MPKFFKLNTAATIPWLGFGTGTALYKKDAADFVKLAIDNGVTHLDGAQIYDNEESLGRGIANSGKPRSELFVTTKLYLPALEPGETIVESLKKSLSKLKLDYVDLFLVHDPTPARKKGNLAEVWEGMEETYRLGLSKAIGVSNFQVKDLNTVLENAKIVPAVNQIELHPYVWKAAKPIVEFSQVKGIAIQSYGGQTPVARVPDGPLSPVLKQISERLTQTRGKSVTPGQVLSKWLLQKDVIVITTTSKVSRLQEYLDTENVPDLTSEEIHAIEEAGEKLHKRIFMQHAFDE